MDSEIELVSDGEGLAILGAREDVDRFLLSTGLGVSGSKELDKRRLHSFMGSAGAAAQIGANVAENSGRWVKLTAESAKAVKDYGLMATKTPGVSHAMIGKPGDIKQWIQIAQAPSALLSGPFALAALSTMMQQRAMQEQMDDIVEYLEEINEKVEDILRNQTDAVLADMIAVDLMIEDALTVRDHVGRVSAVTWSKIHASGMILARTQAYAIRQLDAIAEKLVKKADLGDIAKETKDAEPRVREWLAVLARTIALQDGVAILELDRVLDSEPEDLDSHRLGLAKARRDRVELVGRSTARLISQMNETVRRANSAVLLNPFDAPAAVRSSNKVTAGVLDLRGRLGIESGDESDEAKRWSQAAGEIRDRAIASASGGVTVAGRVGAQTVDRAAGAFRAVDLDGDGIPDKSPAAVAAENAAAALKGAASNVTGTLGSFLKRKPDKKD